MKKISKILLCAVLALALASCGSGVSDIDDNENITYIALSDSTITVDGKAIAEDSGEAVYAANDIIFYLEGQDFTYGEGTEEDAHSQEEADKHTVVHISKPGTYSVSGKLSAGQIAVDLGDGAEEDPAAVVTLILDGADITCTVAPAVIFYNVYECGSTDTETASATVDTAKAGANVIIADGSQNNINGAYVARIYKSVTLNEEGTEVIDSKKLHKYDAAFYSKMTMNVSGGEKGDGVLNINAENEGLDSELHLTINGGVINIESGNDGINTNEDGVSVTTINGGTVIITVNGATGEGDGIDSNGWLVINGGEVQAAAYAGSADSGIDSDMGIYINGGFVIATGNMVDRIEDGGQNHAVFTFNGRQPAGLYTFECVAETNILPMLAENEFTCLLLSHPNLTAGDYTLWQNGVQLAHGGGNMGGFGGFGGGMQRPENFDPKNLPEGFGPENMPQRQEKPEGYERPEGMTPPDGMELPEDFDPNNIPEGMERPGRGERPNENDAATERSEIFTIKDGANYFSNITLLDSTASADNVTAA